MKSREISRVTGKMGDCTVKKKLSGQSGSTRVSNKQQLQKRNVLALAVSCLFFSGLAVTVVSAITISLMKK